MWENFKNGFIKENPVFGLYLGMCSSLAISTSINNAIGMGVCVTLVLIFSNLLVSAMRKITPNEIRIPVYIVIIATLVSVVEMFVHAFTPSLYESLGVFLGLVVVNCIILGRAEAFASKNSIIPSIIDGLGMGLGYTFALLLISGFREFVSTGYLTFVNPFDASQTIFKLGSEFFANLKIDLFSQSAGAFFVFAIFAAIFGILKTRGEKKGAK